MLIRFVLKRVVRLAVLSGGLVVGSFVPACNSGDAEKSADRGDGYSKFLSINHVQSYYHKEPKTQTRYPLVQGTLTNLGPKILNSVELTLRYRDSRHRVIYEERVYPVYVSTLVGSNTTQPLEPGQKTQFAFKSTKCPPSWQPGQVDIEISKVVVK